MVRAVLTARSTGFSGLGFDLATFGSLSCECPCIFRRHVAVYIFFKNSVIFFILPFDELSLIGLALELVDQPTSP